MTYDETWVHHYTPERKRASKEWRGKGEECPVKAKTRLSAGKVMATVFWDFKVVLLVDFHHSRRTVNATYWRRFNRKSAVSPLETCCCFTTMPDPIPQPYPKKNWPYSPDLSPCDYHMFGPLKEALGGAAFRQ